MNLMGLDKALCVITIIFLSNIPSSLHIIIVIIEQLYVSHIHYSSLLSATHFSQLCLFSLAAIKHYCILSALKQHKCIIFLFTNSVRSLKCVSLGQNQSVSRAVFHSGGFKRRICFPPFSNFLESAYIPWLMAP